MSVDKVIPNPRTQTEDSYIGCETGTIIAMVLQGQFNQFDHNFTGYILVWSRGINSAMILFRDQVTMVMG